MALKREFKLYIEAELRDYHQTKKEILELKDDIINQGPDLDEACGNSIVNTNRISRPTENKTIAILTSKRIRRMEQVVSAIETVISRLDDPVKIRFIELRYWKKPRTLTDSGISMELGISKRTLYGWADAICTAIAEEMGLVNEQMKRMRA